MSIEEVNPKEAPAARRLSPDVVAWVAAVPAGLVVPFWFPAFVRFACFAAGVEMDAADRGGVIVLAFILAPFAGIAAGLIAHDYARGRHV